MEYRNPVLPGCHPDPSVCRVGAQFYLATSSFEYFPGVPLYRSRDLVSWERVGHCLSRESQASLTGITSSNGIYAPTLRHHDGTFYLVTTNVSGDGNFVVTADDPTDRWSEPTYLDAPGFDPDLFFDSGTAYLSYANGPTLPETVIKQVPIDLETGEIGDSYEIWRGTEGMFSEAPHLYEIDGTYYLLTAEGGTHVNHMVVAARSDDPTGPFEGCPRNPILSHRGHPMRDIKATGHGDLVCAADGSWWLVFLGIRQHGGHPGWHHLGRETFLAPVEWENGWPVVNGEEPVETDMQVSSLPGKQSSPKPSDPARPTHERFENSTLDEAFEYRRNPDFDAYSLTERFGHLTMWGKTCSLSDPNATFIGRRQAHFECRALADVAFDPVQGEEVGLTAITDERHHYEIGVSRRDGRTSVIVRLRIGDVTEVIAETPVHGSDHRFEIDTTSNQYRFAYGIEDDATTELATAASKYLATEVTGGFTGVYLGMYATRGSSEEVTPARFKRFVYEPLERSEGGK